MVYQSKEQIFEKLDRWLDLPENWDSYGGIAPTIETVERVKKFISTYEILPQGGVFPGPNGEIMLIYLNNNDEIEIYFEPDFNDDMLIIYDVKAENPKMEELSFSVEKFEEFLFK